MNMNDIINDLGYAIIDELRGVKKYGHASESRNQCVENAVKLVEVYIKLLITQNTQVL